MRKIYGIGINDATYKVRVKVDGIVKLCPFYARWHSMMTRCYSSVFLKRHPSYLGSFVCNDWLTFSNFKSWMQTQDWEGNELDKDLLYKGNREYCEDRCLFVKHEVNSFITHVQKSNTNGMIGVSKVGKRYRVSIQNKHLGYFDTITEAMNAWVSGKIDRARQLASCQEDEKVSIAIINYFKNEGMPNAN